MASETPSSLPTLLMVQSIVALLLGVAGLVGVLFGLIGLITGGLGGSTMLFVGLESGETYPVVYGAWMLTGLVVNAVAVLFGGVESLLALGGGILALTSRKTSTLAWAGLICTLHLIVIDLLWSVTNQVGTAGIMLDLGPDSGNSVAVIGLGVAGLIPGLILTLIKTGFWIWTWRSARAFAAQA